MAVAKKRGRRLPRGLIELTDSYTGRPRYVRADGIREFTRAGHEYQKATPRNAGSLIYTVRDHPCVVCESPSVILRRIRSTEVERQKGGGRPCR